MTLLNLMMKKVTTRAVLSAALPLLILLVAGLTVAQHQHELPKPTTEHRHDHNAAPKTTAKRRATR